MTRVARWVGGSCLGGLVLAAVLAAIYGRAMDNHDRRTAEDTLGAPHYPRHLRAV